MKTHDNVLEMARRQLAGAAKYLDLDEGLHKALAHPKRQVIVNFPVVMDNGEVQAKTAFLIYRSHLETDQQLFAGSREDVLRQVHGAWKVAKRTIVLDANVIPDKNLSIFF